MLPGLDLVPTTFNLVDLEAEFTGDPKRPPYLVFQEQLALLEPEVRFHPFRLPSEYPAGDAVRGVFVERNLCAGQSRRASSLIGFTLLVDKLQKFHALSAGFRRASMGMPAQVQAIVFNAVKTGVDIEVPKMRMQLRLNQCRAAKRVAPGARILATRIRDAMVVRRAVALGLPVSLLSSEASESDAGGDNVVGDYHRLVSELLQHDPSLNERHHTMAH